MSCSLSSFNNMHSFLCSFNASRDELAGLGWNLSTWTNHLWYLERKDNKYRINLFLLFVTIYILHVHYQLRFHNFQLETIQIYATTVEPYCLKSTNSNCLFTWSESSINDNDLRSRAFRSRCPCRRRLLGGCRQDWGERLYQPVIPFFE